MKTNNNLKKNIIIVAVSGIIISFLLIYLIGVFIRQDCFRVRNILVKEGDPADFNYLKGQNIFSINFTKELQYALGRYPHYRKVRFIRILPNQVYIDFINRQPLAYLKLYRDFYIDEELVIFSLPFSPILQGVPVISGLEKKLFAQNGARVYNSPELKTALSLLKEIKQNRALDNFKVKRVDLSQPEYISVFGAIASVQNSNIKNKLGISVFEILEVKFGQDKIKDKVFTLAAVLTGAKDKLNNMKYIDLRFKEPVVKFKEK